MDIPKGKWASKTAGLGTEPEVELTDPYLNENDPNKGADWKSGKATYFEMVFEEGYVFHPKHPDKKIEFKYLVLEAYLNRVSLSDYSFYKIPGIEFNKMTGEGDAFLYYTQGTACTEVSLDRISGEVKVLRTDILMDLGRTVNENLDIGQVTGAYIQGLGWVTTENLFYNDQGLLLSHAPSTYKIPNIQDTPRIFNVELLENDENYANVRGTKAVGEPPLLLAISAWTAVNDAIKQRPRYIASYPEVRSNEMRFLSGAHAVLCEIGRFHRRESVRSGSHLPITVLRLLPHAPKNFGYPRCPKSRRSWYVS
jgi:CO/xanthine dehydrogenase Mo-binding subunit